MVASPGGSGGVGGGGRQAAGNHSTPVDTKHLYNIYTMLDQRRRRWADII